MATVRRSAPASCATGRPSLPDTGPCHARAHREPWHATLDAGCSCTRTFNDQTIVRGHMTPNSPSTCRRWLRGVRPRPVFFMLVVRLHPATSMPEERARGSGGAGAESSPEGAYRVIIQAFILRASANRSFFRHTSATTSVTGWCSNSRASTSNWPSWVFFEATTATSADGTSMARRTHARADPHPPPPTGVLRQPCRCMPASARWTSTTTPAWARAKVRIPPATSWRCSLSELAGHLAAGGRVGRDVYHEQRQPRRDADGKRDGIAGDVQPATTRDDNSANYENEAGLAGAEAGRSPSEPDHPGADGALQQRGRSSTTYFSNCPPGQTSHLEASCGWRRLQPPTPTTTDEAR